MIKLYSLWNFGHKKLYKIADHIFISLIQFMHGIVYIEYIPLIYGVNFFLFDGNINGVEPTNYKYVALDNSIIWRKCYRLSMYLSDMGRYCIYHGPLTRYVKLRMRPECRGCFPRQTRVNDPDMHHGTCVTPTSGFHWIRWWGKRSRHSRCMRNP